jgi:hypothetical protein
MTTPRRHRTCHTGHERNVDRPDPRFEDFDLFRAGKACCNRAECSKENGPPATAWFWFPEDGPGHAGVDDERLDRRAEVSPKFAIMPANAFTLARLMADCDGWNALWAATPGP